MRRNGPMYCLKCGNETQDEKVFCPACLEAMEQYPVKPGTAIHLPRQEDSAPQRKSAHTKRPANPEDQVAYLKKTVRRMALLLLICVAALTAAVLQMLHVF